MKILYLGTAAAEGWPALFCRCEACKKARAAGGKDIRTRSQALIDGRLLIDFPPDTYLHTLTYPMNLPELHHCLITHTHSDHFYPADFEMRGYSYADNVPEGDFIVYGNDEVKRRFLELPPDERERVDCKELFAFQPVQIMDYTVTPLLARHNPREKCFIYLIARDGKRLLYGNDTGFFPEETWEYLKDVKLDFVSLDCTMLGVKSSYQGHMGIDRVVETKKRMLDIGCADSRTGFLITHFSHNGNILHDDLVEIMKGHGFSVAYDGLTVEF